MLKSETVENNQFQASHGGPVSKCDLDAAANEANYKNHFHSSPYLFSIFSSAAIGTYLILVH